MKKILAIAVFTIIATVSAQTTFAGGFRYENRACYHSHREYGRDRDEQRDNYHNHMFRHTGYQNNYDRNTYYNRNNYNRPDNRYDNNSNYGHGYNNRGR